MSPRVVRLDGCFNLRDLGGHATPDGRRVRSGCIPDQLRAALLVYPEGADTIAM